MISLALTLALQAPGTRLPVAPPLLVAVTSSPLAEAERTRFRRERDKTTVRDGGISLAFFKVGEFNLLVERRFLPDDLLAVRGETLAALGQVWGPGRALSIEGEKGRALRRGLAGQLPPPYRQEALNAGAVQIHRSATLVLHRDGVVQTFGLDESPKLDDAVYPAGGITLAPESSPDTLPSLPPPSRIAEALDAAGPLTQSRAFEAAFDHLARRWREAGETLRKEHEALDRAIEDDLASRNPHGEPKAGTSFSDLDPKLQAKVRDHFERNHKAFGFSSPEDASRWLSGSVTGAVKKTDFLDFGRWDNGRGGAHVEIRLFLP